jgi:hypothetical protein
MLQLSMKAFGVLSLLTGLAGCVEDGPVESVSGPSPAEQACVAALAKIANNNDIVVVGSEFSEAGTFVRLGLGPDNAPWKCTAYSDGSTDGVEYMGMNG